MKTDLKTKINISQFTLAKGVKENGREIKAIRKYLKSQDLKDIQKFIDNGKIVRIDEKHNIIVDTGLEQIAMGLTGERTTPPEINYGLLGTGTPAVSGGTTKLVNEVYRKQASSRSHSGNAVYIDFFFSASDVSGTFTEFGNVIDGTSTVDTGELFSYIDTGGWVKSSSQSLFISCQYNITNA